MNSNKTAVLGVTLALIAFADAPRAQQPQAPAQAVPPGAVLAPTNHPRLPRDVTQLWLAPEPGRRRSPMADALSMAVKLEADGNFAKALPILAQPALWQGPLGHYAEYFKGMAELRLGRTEEARATFHNLQTRDLVGYLTEAAALGEAESHEARGDQVTALDIYERLSRAKTTAPDEVLMRVGRSARLTGLGDKAAQAYARVYYDYPLSDLAAAAGGELESGPIAAGSSRYARGLERAQRLFAAKRYAQARLDFDALRTASQGDDRELVNLRLAECDVFLKRWRNAKAALRPYLDRATRQGEALYFYGVAARELKEHDEFLKTMRRVIDEFPAQSWAEDALNDLATFHIVQDQDDKADEVFRDLDSRFPAGRFGERAAWKIGWWAYKNGRYAETSRAFDRGAAQYPRSDYRPSWLYWSGRAYDALKDGNLASARYTLAVTDYGNSYYGRLAWRRLADLGQPPPERRLVLDTGTPAPGPAEPAPPAPAAPPNAPVIRALVAASLYDQALDELRYAQRVWGDSPVVQATQAWVYVQQARSATGTEQFNLFRGAINAMKRAYPHYLAAGGEDLPADLLRVIFPLGYWELIQKYAAEYNLDPYVSAALIAQESTFVPDIRSYANAVGLTQLMAPTARQYARVLKIAYAPRLLTSPEFNLRVGMKYFAEKIKEFGEVHLALASYNAGERPVHRWMNERPGSPLDEFIDDIPYPQTQGYVKKILGTAEDYRRLYGPGMAPPEVAPPGAPVAAAGAAPTKAGAKKRAAAAPRASSRKKTTRR